MSNATGTSSSIALTDNEMAGLQAGLVCRCKDGDKCDEEKTVGECIDKSSKDNWKITSVKTDAECLGARDALSCNVTHESPCYKYKECTDAGNTCNTCESTILEGTSNYKKCSSASGRRISLCTEHRKDCVERRLQRCSRARW